MSSPLPPESPWLGLRPDALPSAPRPPWLAPFDQNTIGPASHTPVDNSPDAAAQRLWESVTTRAPRAIAYGLVNAPFAAGHEAAHAQTPDEVIHALTGVGLSMDPRSPAARPSDARGGRLGQAAAIGLGSLMLPEGKAAQAAESGISRAARASLDAIGDVAESGSGKLPRFAILSADREGLPPQLLRERHNALGQMIRDAGYEPQRRRVAQRQGRARARARVYHS